VNQKLRLESYKMLKVFKISQYSIIDYIKH